jgi:hypothetical protein
MRSAPDRQFLASVGALAALAASIVAFSDIALAERRVHALQQPSPLAAGRAARRRRLNASAPSLGAPAYAGSLGCGNRKFCFSARSRLPMRQVTVSRMEANLSDLQARAGGGPASGRPLQRRMRSPQPSGPAISSVAA